VPLGDAIGAGARSETIAGPALAFPAYSEGPEHSARLDQGLLVFAFGRRVRDDAAARVEMCRPGGGHDGADGDVPVAVAAHVPISDCARVDAAAHGFQLVDDLDGANLGRAGN